MVYTRKEIMQRGTLQLTLSERWLLLQFKHVVQLYLMLPVLL